MIRDTRANSHHSQHLQQRMQEETGSHLHRLINRLVTMPLVANTSELM